MTILEKTEITNKHILKWGGVKTIADLIEKFDIDENDLEYKKDEEQY